MSFAQSQFKEVDLSSPDLKELEQLTFQAVNDLRKEKKLPPLVWDEVLYRAAQDQSTFLITQKDLTHSQPTSAKRDPFRRVHLHGGLSYKRVSENLVLVTLGTVLTKKGKKYSTTSYFAAAQAMAQLWKSSPGHYKNLLDEKVTSTAVAISYDRQTQRVVATQVFGFGANASFSEEKDYSETLLTLPERELPYNLKKPRETKKASRSTRAFMRMKFHNGHLVGRFKDAKRAFRGRRGGIAQEFIPLTQFDSGAVDFNQVRNRRNGLFVLNGEMSKPVYRAKILRHARKMTLRKVIINLGIIKIKAPPGIFAYPLQDGGYQTSYNVFLIRKKRIQTYRMSMCVPGELIFEPMPALRFKSDFDGKIPENKKVLSRFDTAEVRVFYRQKSTEPDSLTQTLIRNMFDQRKGKIVGVETSSFASVEGNQRDNENIALQRMNNFMAMVQPYLDTVSVVPSITTNEQWNMFYKQIRENNLEPLRGMSKTALRDYVNLHQSDSLIAKLLDDQRYTLFKMMIRFDSTIIIPPPDEVARYYAQKKKFEAKLKPTASDVSALEAALMKAYRQLANTNDPRNPEVLVNERYPSFQYYDLLFRYIIRKGLTDEQFYSALKVISNNKRVPYQLKRQLVYNNLVLIYKNFWPEDELSRFVNVSQLYCTSYRRQEFLKRHYKKLRCTRYEDEFGPDYYALKEIAPLQSLGKSLKITDFPTDSLQRFYVMSTLAELSSYFPLPSEVDNLLIQVKKYYHPNDALLTLDDRVQLAFFYCVFGKYDIARALLKPLTDNPTAHLEGYKLYVTLQFDSFKNEHDFADYMILQYDVFGKDEWCGIWQNGKYLNFLLLEDLKLKNFYNCHCNKAQP